VWNDWLPEWLKSKSTAELQHIFDSHVDQLVGRYAGRIRYWDLVNEPFVPLWYREQGWRRGAWFDAFGPDYITRALQRAAVADPKARLFINEAALEQDDEIGQSLRPHVLNQLRRIVDSGAPLHGFGVESHLRPGLPHDYSAFADWLAQIGELGLEIHITELDVFDDPFPDDFAARDAAVAGIYTDYLNAVLAVPQVKAVVFWGLKESYGFPYWMWKNANKSEGRAPRGLLYDDTLQPRPAHDAAIAALRGASKRSSLER
jgi:endo-1,4-beta-xylanase